MVSHQWNAGSTTNELSCPHTPLVLPIVPLSLSLSLSLSGVRIVAGAVGDLPSVLDSHQLGAALGGLEDVPSSATTTGGNISSKMNGGDGDSASDGQEKVIQPENYHYIYCTDRRNRE